LRRGLSGTRPTGPLASHTLRATAMTAHRPTPNHRHHAAPSGQALMQEQVPLLVATPALHQGSPQPGAG
jgi:hypothetical protein